MSCHVQHSSVLNGCYVILLVVEVDGPSFVPTYPSLKHFLQATPTSHISKEIRGSDRSANRACAEAIQMTTIQQQSSHNSTSSQKRGSGSSSRKNDRSVSTSATTMKATPTAAGGGREQSPMAKTLRAHQPYIPTYSVIVVCGFWLGRSHDTYRRVSDQSGF